MKSKITIVMATDNFYAILSAALIKSLEFNHSRTDEILDIYIIDDGISAQNKTKIIASINKEMTTLTWVDSKTIITKDVKLPMDKSAFPLTAYMRLFAPYIVAKDVDKLIYMDVDMIATKDISLLWNIDIGDYLFAAVKDFGETVSCSWGGVPNYKELGIPPETKYFNSGLLVINKEKWINSNVTARVLENMHNNIEHMNFADQYGLNITLYDQWFELDKNWNCFSHIDYEDPYIIHFLDIKPIFKSYKLGDRYKNEFFKYLDMTAWQGFKPIGDFSRLRRKAYNKISKFVRF